VSQTCTQAALDRIRFARKFTSTFLDDVGHELVHAGQLAFLRRLMGKAPLR
jgi:hypothetical protein